MQIITHGIAFCDISFVWLWIVNAFFLPLIRCSRLTLCVYIFYAAMKLKTTGIFFFVRLPIYKWAFIFSLRWVFAAENKFIYLLWGVMHSEFFTRMDEIELKFGHILYQLSLKFSKLPTHFVVTRSVLKIPLTFQYKKNSQNQITISLVQRKKNWWAN